MDHGEVVAAASEKVAKLTLEELHRRLGHIAPDAARRLVQDGVITGIELVGHTTLTSCASCEYAKMTRKQIRKEREEPLAEHFGDEVHMDVWGPSPVESLGGRRYFHLVIDDATRWTFTKPMRTKDGSFQSYKEVEAWAETQHGVRIKRCHSDRGGEFTGTEFSTHLAAHGTERRLTTHDTPQHNGVAESANRRLLERVRALLHQSDLPKTLWAEALQHATWLKNRLPTRALGGRTPFEALYGKKPDLAGLPEWGAPIWCHSATGSKLDARAKDAIWVGYDKDSTHAHRVYWPGRRTVSVERDIKFQELDTQVTLPTPITAPTPIPTPTVVPTPPDSQLEGENRGNKQKVEAQPKSRKGVRSMALDPVKGVEYEGGRSTRSGTTLGPAASLAEVPGLDEDDFHVGGLEFAMAAAIQSLAGLEPSTLAAARKRDDWSMWEEAMRKEIASLVKAGTWEVVERPEGKNVIGCKWVYRLKLTIDRAIDKYKARLVARGFTQVYGVDYTETFAPVARLSSLRVILAYATRYDWPIDVFDFNSAFLNGELDPSDELYMEQPPGFEVTSDKGRPMVLRLRKALYGLKQGGRTWYETICKMLKEEKFVRTEADQAVFVMRQGPHQLVLAIHVDDCTMAGTSQPLIDDYRERFNRRYSLTNLGPINWLLGIEVVRNRTARTIALSQQNYIAAMLERFQLSDAQAMLIPMDPNISFSREQCPSNPQEVARMRRMPYRELIGSLMYLAVGTRPDIAFAVSTLSQFLENPGEVHWEAARRILRYLKGTKDWRLTFGTNRCDLVGYTDADGASQEHRRAISGYAFLVDGGAVSWSSHKQELVTLSTTESEYVAATYAAKEAIWLRRLIGEVFTPIDGPVTLYGDNKSAIAIATNGNYHARTKHIDIRYHYIRFVIEDGTIELLYCPTDDMTADTLTKALASAKARHFAAALGLRFA